MLSENQMVSVRKSCETMYDHICNIYVSQETVDASTGVSSFIDALLYENQPCHIAQTAIAARSNGIASDVTNVISLYISPDLVIPAGSRIVCNGREYNHSGLPINYGAFQKIQLEFIGEKA